jgi:hypothetical protein
MSGPQRVHDGHPSPLLFVEIGLIYFLLGFDVGLEICCHQVDVIVVGDGADQLHQQVLLAESACSDCIDYLF